MFPPLQSLLRKGEQQGKGPQSSSQFHPSRNVHFTKKEILTTHRPAQSLAGGTTGKGEGASIFFRVALEIYQAEITILEQKKGKLLLKEQITNIFRPLKSL